MCETTSNDTYPEINGKKGQTWDSRLIEAAETSRHQGMISSRSPKCEAATKQSGGQHLSRKTTQVSQPEIYCDYRSILVWFLSSQRNARGLSSYSSLDFALAFRSLIEIFIGEVVKPASFIAAQT